MSIVASPCKWGPVEREVAGMVVDAAGKPVNSFTVTIQGQTPAEGESTATSRMGESRDELRGTFMLDGLAPGTYTLVASRPEGGAVQSGEIVVGRGKVVRGVRLPSCRQTKTE